MTDNIVNFPFLKPPGYRPGTPKAPVIQPVWQSGQRVRHLKSRRSIGVIKSVHTCPLFKNVSAILVEFDTVREWCKPEDLMQAPRWEMS